MKVSHLIVLFLLPVLLFGQNKDAFRAQFTEAKDLLYNFHPEEALPILLSLEKKDPTNANVLYLIGACYTDYSPESDESVKYLEKAEPFISDKYDADSPDERSASIHLYYFLAVAYAQNHR